jgi:Zinc carboxypeptidase
MKWIVALAFLVTGSVEPAAPAVQPSAAVALPQPASIFGFEPGTDRKLADYGQIVRYFRALDAATDRVRLFEIGKTAEGREMVLSAISSEANLARLDRYRDIARQLADSRGLTDDQARALAREGKTIVWLDMGLHATEVAHAQVSAEVARLIAGGDTEEIRRLRENAIVLLMPVMNPDGLEIVTKWYRANVGTPFETSPLPVLYQKHAGHDNNRDWFMQNLPETQNVTRQLYQVWFPQILYNHHQSGLTSPRIWAPPMDDPVNPNMHPLVNRGISLLGIGIMQRLEQEGKRGAQGYSTYSNWWNGGMRSTPCFHNVVGILTETASGRYATPVEITEKQLPARLGNGENAMEPSTWNPSPWKGGTWRLRDQMDYMVTATMAVMRLAADYREDWLYNRYQMARDQIAVGKRGKPYAYVIPAGQRDWPTAVRLAEILDLGAVEVHRAAADFTAGSSSYGAGSFVVLMSQPHRGYAKDLLEPQRHPDRRDGPNGPPKRPYDMAGWTLPYQMGVRADMIEDAFDAPLERVISFGSVSGASAPAPPVSGPNLEVTGRIRELAAAGRAPRVALYKSWVASMDEGWARFVLEQFSVPYQSLYDKDVRAGNLRARFDGIVLPDQSAKDIIEGHSAGTMPAEYVGGIGVEGVAALKAFVDDGGTLIAIDGATDVPIQQFGIPVRNAIEGVRNTEFYCPGSLLRLSIDTSHPLMAGIQDGQAAFFVNGRAFDVDAGAGDRVRVAARYATDRLLMSGWINGEAKIAGKAAVVEASLGRGKVVLVGFGPYFRGQPHGTFRILFNPILQSVEGGSSKSQVQP